MYDRPPGLDQAVAGSIETALTGVAVYERTTVRLPDSYDAVFSWEVSGSQVTSKLSWPLPVATRALLGVGDGWQVFCSWQGRSGSWVESIPLGCLDMVPDTGDTEISWTLDGKAQQPHLQPSAVNLTAEDRLIRLSRMPFTRDTSPTPGATVRATAIKVVDRLLSVGAWTASDTVDSTGVVWTDSRADALGTVLGQSGLVPWVDRHGVLQAIPTTQGTPVAQWDVIDYRRGGLSDALVNTITVDGTGSNQEHVSGTATITTGPLRYGGPFGRRGRRVSNELMRTNAACQSMARHMLANIIRTTTIPVTVTIPVDPCLDPLDTVTISTPEGDMTGLAVAGAVSGGSALMSVTVAVPWQEVPL